jgi:twitching motility protein PilT
MIVDPLLKLLEAQSASALIIRPAAAPVLERAGAKVALSMPALDADMVAMILEEVLSEPQRAALAGGDSIESEHRSGDGHRFSVLVDRPSGAAADLRLSFRPVVEPRAGAKTSAAAPTRVATAPVAASPSRSADAPIPPAPAAAVMSPSPAPTRAYDDAQLARALDLAEHHGASDVLIASGHAVRLRVGGTLMELDDVILDEPALLGYFEPHLDAAHRDELARSGSTDIALDLRDRGAGRRWRVNLFRRHGGASAALRPIRTDVPSLRELALPDDFHELTQHRSGLVLVTGTAGAGKSTTLVALVEHVNRTAPKHVITLEDPIEYEYQPARALVQQREIGRHVADFAAGLRAALRESPDIIMVGELRDRETVAAALTAAETGHLVLATMHAGSASMAIDRVVDVFPEHQQGQIRVQLAAVLRAVITQVLLPSTRPPARVPAYERLLVTTAVAAKIRDLRGHQIQSEIQKGRADGMVSFELAMARLVRAGRLGVDVAMTFANDKQLLAELMRQI